MNGKLKVVLVGLSFGAEFVPIYLKHPNVECLAICDSDEKKLQEVGDKYEIEKRFTGLNQVLESTEFDAVHLVTPVTLHAQQSVAVLRSGKHCACTIPMGMSIDEIKSIISAKKDSNKVYMMMETAVYTREYLYAKHLYETGELGKIQFARCAHYQDMEGWPEYWKGFPPLKHPTHALSPTLDLLGKRPYKVHCFGSGHMRDELVARYGNPFPIETSIIKLEDSDVVVELTRNMFQMARAYTECFSVYGERASFEWQQLEEEKPVVFRMSDVIQERGSQITSERVDVPDRQDLLPKEIGRFTKRGVYDESNPHLSFLQGGGHGGSHPHLVNEFVRSIIENRKPYVDEIKAANWTAAGICAHESAMNDGKEVFVPRFD